MSFIKLTPEYHDKWNKFSLKNHWFWHSTYWIEYMINSKIGVEFVDHSFFTETNTNRVMTNIVPLIQEGDKLISPGFIEEREILKEINRIATENNVKHIQVNSDIKKYLGLIDYTCVLDLDDIRPSKGHKASIKKGEQHLKFGNSNLAYMHPYDTERFRKFYINVAKKETRPKKAFELLGKWLQQGFGTLLEALLDDKTVGYVYVLHWGKYAYYFMSCVPMPYKQYNVTHFLMSKAFEILREKGVTYLEMGEMVYNSLHYHPIEKERSISKFKKGFGGNIIIKPASEYFMSQEYMIDVYANRIHEYWKCEHEKNINNISQT